MGCCNLRILCFIVASLNAAAYLIAIMWDIIYLNTEYDLSSNPHGFTNFDVHQNNDVHAGFLLLIVFAVGFLASLLFIKGLHQDRMRFMAPLVYFKAACILFSLTSIISVYNTYLMKVEFYLQAIVIVFTHFLSLGLFILFVSPLFIIYQRMRSSSKIRIVATTREVKPRPVCVN
ncbi:uncharacterized protein LOC106090871 [Stomoxys calcitrans]|uniref:uncharacterized protein LOC106090871 n=1 Tax=Stomoxys calcitrans TaxID=35570 RepID=UPI0027E284FF|nr:uncharacterized protein LOC106090871 [Stomoxys calcitrans]